MIALLKRFFMDETSFIRMVRAILMAVGALASTGQLPPFVPDWLGALAMGAAMTLGAGDKNPKATEPVAEKA